MVTTLEKPRVCNGQPLVVEDAERRVFRFCCLRFRIDACPDDPLCFRAYSVDGHYPPGWALARAVTIRGHDRDGTAFEGYLAWAGGGGEFQDEDLFAAVGKALASVL